MEVLIPMPKLCPKERRRDERVLRAGSHSLVCNIILSDVAVIPLLGSPVFWIIFIRPYIKFSHLALVARF